MGGEAWEDGELPAEGVSCDIVGASVGAETWAPVRSSGGEPKDQGFTPGTLVTIFPGFYSVTLERSLCFKTGCFLLAI